MADAIPEHWRTEEYDLPGNVNWGEQIVRRFRSENYERIPIRCLSVLDAPVTTENLKYMRRQSGHAEITPWSFESEYDFGDFHGNAVGMLQRGYDIHLHYANFGVRSLMLRLPHGFPDSKAAHAYLEPDILEFKKTRGGLWNSAHQSRA